MAEPTAPAPRPESARTTATARERPRQPGNSNQLAIIVILILIFIVIATRRIWELRIVAEQTAVVHMVGTLQSAIGIQVMERVLRGGLDAIATMEHGNPMDYLEQPPVNYQRLDGPLPPEQLVPYRWYYEPVEGLLIYRVQHGDYLETDLPGPARIRFQLRLHYDDTNGNGRYDAVGDNLGSVTLVPLEHYRWLTP